MILVLAALAFIFLGGLNNYNPSKVISANNKLEVKGRKMARTRARAGIELLLTDHHHKALDHLNRAIRADDSFTEAYLARSVAHLGAGQAEEAMQDADTAISMLRDTPPDEFAWKNVGDLQEELGVLIAHRVHCIASEVGRSPLTPDQGIQLVRLFREFSSSADCDQAQHTLDRWENEGRIISILDRARMLCPQLWTCNPSS